MILNVAPDRLAGTQPPSGWPICDSYPPLYGQLSETPVDNSTSPVTPSSPSSLNLSWQSQLLGLVLLILFVVLICTFSLLLNQLLSFGFGFSWIADRPPSQQEGGDTGFDSETESVASSSSSAPAPAPPPAAAAASTTAPSTTLATSTTSTAPSQVDGAVV